MLEEFEVCFIFLALIKFSLISVSCISLLMFCCVFASSVFVYFLMMANNLPARNSRFTFCNLPCFILILICELNMTKISIILCYWKGKIFKVVTFFVAEQVFRMLYCDWRSCILLSVFFKELLVIKTPMTFSEWKSFPSCASC